MSKTRPSPRRGGRRSKATPPIPSSEDTPPAPPKQKPKIATKVSRNVTPPSKKVIKPGQMKGKRNSSESKGKSNKGKKQLNITEREECNNETEEPMEVIAGTNNPSEGEREDVKAEEEEVLEEEDEKLSARMDNEPGNQSIGEELMECLSKSGKKKKAMRNCSSCGVQSPVSRAKKCPNCGKNLFSKSSGYIQEINCPKCDYQQRYNGTLATAFCGRCNTLITRKYKESSPDDTNGSTHEMSEVADKLTDIEENATIEYDRDSLPQQNSLPCPVNSDGSFQLGYSYNTVEDKNSNETVEEEVGVVATPTDDNESSQETIRRIIKRKILDNIESSDTPDSKRPCSEVEDQPVEPNDPSGKVSLTLNIPVNMSLAPPTSSASSPLVEYAQKISARLLIPPEIPPQESSRRGRTRPPNSRAGKSHLSKSKRAHKDPAHLASDLPPSPEQLEPSLVEGPPPLVHTNEEPVCDQSRVLSPPPLISKTFHDSTINSIRQNNTTSTFYSSPSSKAPPLTVSSSTGYCSPLEAAHANGQVVSKNLYPDQLRTSSVPPLLSIDEVEGGVARTMVIVDPTKAKVKDSSAPPTLLHEPEYVNEVQREEGQYSTEVTSDWLMDCTVKAKHSKRKQKLHLSEPITQEEDEVIIYETVKKKKKKKKKEKDKERSDKSHKIKGDKHKSDSDKKVKKKQRKGKRRADEMTSDNAMDDESSQYTIETIDTRESINVIIRPSQLCMYTYCEPMHTTVCVCVCVLLMSSISNT